MTPIIKHGKRMSQLNVTPIYPDTTVVVKESGKGILLYENDQLIAWLTFPIMKVIRGIRKMYPNANIVLI